MEIFTAGAFAELTNDHGCRWHLAAGRGRFA
jgi:hypothetical protein